MASTAEITFKEFRRRYNTEDACRAELFRLRFPNGFVCPKCGCVEYYPVHGRNIYQCRSCRHQTSVTAGTVMHRTHLPLTLWFWAIYLCATDKRGISAVQLSRTLGICYDSAWHLLDRIRTAMGQRDEKSTFYRSAQRRRQGCSIPPEWMLNLSGRGAQSGAEYSTFRSNVNANI